jgi:hypothetical protein
LRIVLPASQVAGKVSILKPVAYKTGGQLLRDSAHFSMQFADAQDKKLPIEMSYNDYLTEIWDNEFYAEFNMSFVNSGAIKTATKHRLTARSIPPDIRSFKIWYEKGYSHLMGL